MPELKFEEALKKLEKIVADLEAGEMPLDESLAKYEEGIRLSKICSRQLEAAKSKVELLMKAGGKFELSPFEGSEKEAKSKAKPKRAKKSDDSPGLF